MVIDKINMNIGFKFNKLTIVSYNKKVGQKHKVNAICDCGNTAVVEFNKILSGHTKSCGCLTTKHNLSSGKKKTKIYRAWRSMMGRCFNKNVKRYSIYGGRGITVCDRWMDFSNFLSDMGMPPSSNHSLDRIDNNGNYEPTNCRWATIYEQANNKRRNVYVNINGEKMSVSQAERLLGFPCGKLKSRLYLGYSIDDAIQKVLPKKRCR